MRFWAFFGIAFLWEALQYLQIIFFFPSNSSFLIIPYGRFCPLLEGNKLF